MGQDASLLTPELCFIDWECGSAEELFRRLEAELAPRGLIAPTWLEGILARERAYPTGLRVPTCGLAIPHTDPCHILRPYIAVVRPRVPVTFEAMAGMGDPVPASIVVNLGIVRDGGQVAVLQDLMEIFTDAARAEHVMAQRTPAELAEAITGYFSA